MQVVRKGSKDRVEFVLVNDQTFEPIAINAVASECSVLDYNGGAIGGPYPITVEDTARAVYTPTANWDLEIREGFCIAWTLHDGSGNIYTRKTFFAQVFRGFDSQVLDSDLTKEDPIAQSRLPNGVTTFASWRKSAWRDISLHVSRAVSQSPGTLFFPDEFKGAHIKWSLRDFYRSNGSLDAGDVERADRLDQDGLNLIQQVLQRVAMDTDETDTLNDPSEIQNRTTNWRI